MVMQPSDFLFRQGRSQLAQTFFRTSTRSLFRQENAVKELVSLCDLIISTLQCVLLLSLLSVD